MDKLMSIAEYRKTRFTPASMPTRQTIAKWCNDGDIPAKQIGSKWFILIQKEQQETGDPLVDRILNERA